MSPVTSAGIGMLHSSLADSLAESLAAFAARMEPAEAAHMLTDVLCAGQSLRQ